MRAAKVQASLRIRAVSPEPPLLAHTSNESSGTFRQKARSLAPLNGNHNINCSWYEKRKVDFETTAPSQCYVNVVRSCLQKKSYLTIPHYNTFFSGVCNTVAEEHLSSALLFSVLVHQSRRLIGELIV